MNNKFSDFVKKSKITTLSKLIGFFLAIIIVVLIAIVTKPIIVISCFFVLIGIIFYVTTDKERKQVVKYRLGVDVNNNIYIPLVLNNDYLKKLCEDGIRKRFVQYYNGTTAHYTSAKNIYTYNLKINREWSILKKFIKYYKFKGYAKSIIKNIIH